MSSPRNLSGPCHCQSWHVNCEPSSCPQAKRKSAEVPIVSLKKFRESGERGCPTCAIITSALDIPDIKKIWHQSIELALQSQRWGVVTEMRNNEEEIRIELFDNTRERRILRTRGSESSEDWRHFNFWRGEHSSQPNESCRAFPPLQFHPVERTDSAHSIKHLQSWVRECAENHTCCSSDDPILPARVVKVTDNQIRVYNAQGLRGRYTTLSHRWGTNETFRLIRLNIGPMADCIPWDSIPRLYQQSIEVTRLLGIDYIWIDTLCIVQDDAEDWQREAGKMKSVYGNSYLNIAANQAVDSSGDLFTSSSLGVEYPACKVPRYPDIQIRPQPHLTHRHFGSNYTNFPAESPLMQRGWVLQERILSPRVVHYDADEIKWECQAATDCQCGGMMVIANFKIDYYGGLKPDGTPLPYQWMRISERYGSLKFTYDSDRLVALAGLAEQGVQSGKGGRYFAGLWEHKLAHQLCWQITNTHRRPEVYLAPSWSWLSVFGSVRYNNRMDFTSTCSHIDVKITEVSCLSTEGNMPTTSTSPIIGFIRLKGRGMRMRAELSSPGTQSVPPVYFLRTEGGDVPVLKIIIRADYVMTQQEAAAVTEVFFLFWGCMWPNENAFLVLKPISAERPKFRRLGIMLLPQQGGAENMRRILAHCTTKDPIYLY
ncbi:heterokaryon incompatibility protein-domain-containing protein [Xylaria sp. FL0064]|nr:heterokaryon incompatibility protein-domain-containing protein [Xylaria sp. FL0064]